MRYFLIIALLVFFVPKIQAQTALEIIQKAEENFRASDNIAEIKMTLVRPKWTREMVMKSWNKGEKNALILVKAPARDKGTTFLKKDNEIWNWLPSVEKVVKLPPSMMLQSWMGSDFTNDDLVRSSSIIDDYEHELMGQEDIDGLNCHKIKLIPKPDAPVVWGSIITWISVEDLLQLKSEFYDEDGYLINVMEGKDVKEMDGRLIPAKMILTPVEEDGQQTIIEYLSIDFDADIDDGMFSTQQMKRIR